ncbi:MAG: hypothetical protein R2822_08475 [Spirosomataceae bacterium]
MIHNRIGAIAYRQQAKKAVVDGQITVKDKAALDELQAVISISDELAVSILKEVCQTYLNQLMKQLSINARITPDEDQRLNHTVKSLKVRLSVEARTRCRTFKEYWNIENQPLTSVEVTVALQKSEECYFSCEECSMV